MATTDRAIPTKIDAETGGTWTFYDSFVAFPHSSVDQPRERCVAHVQISLNAEGGGTHGEFAVRWYRFDHFQDEAFPKLEVFGDGWAVFARSGLVDLLARYEERRPTPGEFMDELFSMGYLDRTEKLGVGPSFCPTCSTEGFKGNDTIVRWRERVEAG